ncbi:hypothetical protein QM012_007896 [Aureobasidium pullulans]|uniref:Uncharacterized protein n=1 Tax=Aureobasidium pullulans TaxID=5580 RepID=A0ABR0TL13_AURPU
MDVAKTITLSNGVKPLETSTVKEEYTAAMPSTNTATPLSSHHQSEEQDEHDGTRSFLDFEKPGPVTLLFCLLLNMLVTISWYYLNVDTPASDTVSPAMLCRMLYDGIVLFPMGFFSLVGCLYCFGTLLCLRRDDRALCIARVALGGMLGASVVVKYGLEAGVFGSAPEQLCFWAMTGITPGAGAVALVGFCWDCLYWDCESEEDSTIDEKRPLLEKEEV